MRGDQKWPPTETKAQMELENEARRKLAQGPAFRPKRMQKVGSMNVRTKNTPKNVNKIGCLLANLCVLN